MKTHFFLFVMLLFVGLSVGATTFYVAIDGNDDHPGTLDKPFGTLDAARQAVRKVYAEQPRLAGGVTVLIRGGYYYLEKPFELSAIDSGRPDAPVVYRAYQNERVVLSGGRLFDRSLFEPISDPQVKDRIIDPAAREKVVQVDLVKAGVDLSKIGRMKRFGLSLEAGGVGTDTAPTEVFFEDNPMKVARWPNEGFVKVEEVIEGGSNPRVHRRDVNGEMKVSGPTYIPGVFRYAEDRPKYWLNAREVWLHGFWAYDWADDCMPIAKIDTEKREITMGGVHEYGLKPILGGGRYYALNMLEEIDRPGEYYIDPYVGMLYFYPPPQTGDGKWGLSMTAEPLLKMKDVSYVAVERLVFEMCRDMAVMMEGGQGNRIAGCTVRNTGGWAVLVDGGAQHTVQSCDIYNVGRGGIRLVGGDQKKLVKAGHKAVNNHIHHFSRRARTYQFALAINGVGITAANNRIHDAPHCAMDYRGNFNVIELNEIYRVGLESDDAGAINSDRDYSIRGNVIRHNNFYDVVDLHPDQPWLGNHMIYYDSCTSGEQVVGNIFRNGGRVAININGGRDMTVKNNIFMDLKHPVEVKAIALGPHKPVMISAYNIMMSKIDPQSEVWKTHFPELANYTDDWDELGIPRGNVISDNLFVRTQDVYVEPHPQVPDDAVRVENNLSVQDSPFVDIESFDFRLRDDFSDVEKMPWLKQIPFDKIGLYKDAYRTELPERKKG